MDQTYSQDTVVAALRAEGFRHVVSGEQWAWGVRWRYSPLGTLAFHVGILLLIGGLALSFSPSLRFEGSLVLAEGETYTGDVDTYIDRPDEAQGTPPELAFGVKDIEPRFYQDLLLFTGLEAQIETSSTVRGLSLSTPWVPRPDTLVGLTDFGYALEVSAASDETTEQVTSVYKLQAFPSGQSDNVEIDVGTDTYRIYVEVYGDYVDRDGVPGVKSFNSDNPYLLVSVASVLSASGERMLVTDQLVPIGSGIDLPGLTISFPGLRYYGVFRVVRNIAAPLMLVALALLVLGTVVRLMTPRTEALITASEDAEQPGMWAEVRSDVYATRSRLTRKLADRVVER